MKKIILTTGIFLSLLPVSSHALMIKSRQLPRAEMQKLRDTRGQKSSSSAPSTAAEKWKTYHSSLLHVTFNIPESWQVKQELPTHTTFENDRAVPLKYDRSFMSVSRDALKKTLTLDEMYKRFTQNATVVETGDTIAHDNYVPSYTLLSREDTTLGGEPALLIHFTDDWYGATWKNSIIFVLHNGIQYTLFKSHPLSEDAKEGGIITTMRATFQFTRESPTEITRGEQSLKKLIKRLRQRNSPST